MYFNESIKKQYIQNKSNKWQVKKYIFKTTYKQMQNEMKKIGDILSILFLDWWEMKKNNNNNFRININVLKIYNLNNLLDKMNQKTIVCVCTKFCKKKIIFFRFYFFKLGGGGIAFSFILETEVCLVVEFIKAKKFRKNNVFN